MVSLPMSLKIKIRGSSFFMLHHYSNGSEFVFEKMEFGAFGHLHFGVVSPNEQCVNSIILIGFSSGSNLE
jgi:hypothetical protein